MSSVANTPASRTRPRRVVQRLRIAAGRITESEDDELATPRPGSPGA